MNFQTFRENFPRSVKFDTREEERIWRVFRYGIDSKRKYFRRWSQKSQERLKICQERKIWILIDLKVQNRKIKRNFLKRLSWYWSILLLKNLKQNETRNCYFFLPEDQKNGTFSQALKKNSAQSIGDIDLIWNGLTLFLIKCDLKIQDSNHFGLFTWEIKIWWCYFLLHKGSDYEERILVEAKLNQFLQKWM